MSLTSHALLWLAQHPDVRARLIEHPEGIPAACEEFLRWSTPTQGLARTVTRECTFADTQFKSGDRVLLAWASGNLDPETFDNPAIVDIDRKPNPPLAFGVGGHRCIGASLARIEFADMVGAILDGIPDYDVVPEAVEYFPITGVANGLLRLPITFNRQHRRGYDSTLLRKVRDAEKTKRGRDPAPASSEMQE